MRDLLSEAVVLLLIRPENWFRFVSCLIGHDSMCLIICSFPALFCARFASSVSSSISLLSLSPIIIFFVLLVNISGFRRRGWWLLWQQAFHSFPNTLSHQIELPKTARTNKFIGKSFTPRPRSLWNTPLNDITANNNNHQPCQHCLSQATTPSTNSGHHWQRMAWEHPFEGNYGASQTLWKRTVGKCQTAHAWP